MLSVSSYNPMLQYKLDPGEWGSSLPASAATSISKVASHESSNIQYFANRAAEKGCYVISKDLYLNLSKKGVYLSATSGRSSVAIYCPKKEENERIKANFGIKINSKIHKYSSDELNINLMLKSSKNDAMKDVYRQDLKRVKERKLELEQKKFSLYTQLTLLLAQHLNVDPNMINMVA